MIEIGKSITRQIDVDDSRAISFMGPDLRVYSTPSVLYDIEMSCRDLLRTMVEADHDSVGHHVSLYHLDMVPIGGRAEITATIAAIEKKQITFEASVTSGQRTIATAKHIRIVVPIARLKARIANIA